jgi:DNA-binding Lrp family transcriptional regulator
MNTVTVEPLELDGAVVAVDFIFQNDRSKLALVGCELATYLVCSAAASGRRSSCRFELTSQQLATATGYTVRQINRTIHKLQDSGHIIRISPYVPMYELGSPKIVGVKVALADGKDVTLRTVLHFNRMPYLQLPLEFFSRLPGMSSVELQATIALLEMTWLKRSISIKAASWARRANIANTRDLCAVLDKMGWCWDIEQIGRDFWIHRTDRDRREEQLDRAMERAIEKNHAPERPYTSEVLGEWLAALGVKGEGGNSDLRIQCPKCRGIRPSLSINLDVGMYGVFYCHVCGFGKKKVILHLLDKLDIPRKIYRSKLREIFESRQSSSPKPSEVTTTAQLL